MNGLVQCVQGQMGSERSMRRLGVLTSGGDAPGMNAAIRAVVRACTFYGVTAVGIEMGYRGLVDNVMSELTSRDVKGVIQRGGTMLRSARCKRFMTVEGRAQAYGHYVANGLDALVVIGGDGTFTGAQVFGQEFDVPVIGIPATIDNDIYGTDTTIGFDTAQNTVVEALDKIRDTATSHNRVFLIEVMGRDAGFLALNSGIAGGVQEILIPEERLDVEKMFASLDKASQLGKLAAMVVVAEGEEGGVYEMANKIRAHAPEYDLRVTVLGHLQRGGAPSCADRVLASRLGVAAVEGLLAGRRQVMAGMQGDHVCFVSFSDAVQKVHEIDHELIRIAHILGV